MFHNFIGAFRRKADYKYGKSASIDNYVIYFEPYLGVLELK